MKADDLISRLDRVKETGSGQWIACCPAHADKTPSMTIREVDDGRVLVHCFAGCEVAKILEAVGLTFDALFPDKPAHRYVKLRRPFNAADVLACVALEAHVVLIIADDLAAGRAIDIDRLRLASRRLLQAKEIALG